MMEYMRKRERLRERILVLEQTLGRLKEEYNCTFFPALPPQDLMDFRLLSIFKGEPEEDEGHREFRFAFPSRTFEKEIILPNLTHTSEGNNYREAKFPDGTMVWIGETRSWVTVEAWLKHIENDEA